jgi:hypothetical protein
MQEQPDPGPQINQPYVDQLITEQIRHSPLRTQELNPDAAVRISNNEVAFVGDQIADEKKVMLASVSKIGIFLAQEEALLALPEQVAINPDILAELVGRQPTRITENPAYAHISEWLGKGIDRLVAAQNLNKETEAAKIRQEIETKIREHMQTNEVTIPREELAYHVLTLSSNSATRLVKELSPAYSVALKEIAPSFEPLETTANFAHWFQPNPNVGKVSEFAQILDDLVHKHINGECNEFEEELLASMRNNPTDFNFDFTHSELGQELIENGWEVYEKTGYYPIVYWVQGLKDIPHHMVLANVCTIYNPATEQVYTFHHHMEIAVAYPKTVDPKLKEQTGVSFPNEWDPSYVAYSKSVQTRFGKIFREELAAALTDLKL